MGFTKADTRVAKATAVIWMCMHHLFAFPDRFPRGVAYISMFPWDLENALGHAGRVCVAMFVFLSGFGTWMSLEETADPWKKTFRKIRGLYRKYWAVFLVFIPVAVLLGDPQVTLTPWDLIKNLTALEPSYNGEWWFLPPFLLLTLVSPLLVSVIRRSKRDWLWFCGMFLAVQIIAPGYLYESIAAIFHNAFAFLPGFWLGCITAKHRLFDRYLTRVNTWGSLGITVVCVTVRIFVGQALDVLLAPVLCVAAAGLARGIPVLRKIKEEIGSVSTEIWLIHSFFCYHFIPEIVFAPKYSVLVLLTLLTMSYASGKVIVFLTDKIKTASR